MNCTFTPIIGRVFLKYGPKVQITTVIRYMLYVTIKTDTATWMINLTHIIWKLGVGMVLASTKYIKGGDVNNGKSI